MVKWYMCGTLNQVFLTQPQAFLLHALEGPKGFKKR
jgi:hypothetical protein